MVSVRAFSLRTFFKSSVLFLIFLTTLVFYLVVQLEENRFHGCSHALPNCRQCKFDSSSRNTTALHSRNEMKRGEAMDTELTNFRKGIKAISLQLRTIESSMTQLHKSQVEQRNDFKQLRESLKKVKRKEKRNQPSERSGRQQVSSLKEVFKGKKECHPHEDDLFPFCREKYELFRYIWKESCYSGIHGVNISDPCSMLIFLSEVEPWCPMLPWRPVEQVPKRRKASIRTDKQGLLELLKYEKLAWMRMRIESTWSEWVQAVTSLEQKQDMSNRLAQRILVLLGGFTVNIHFLDLAFKGGPLGELVQWSDVISALYILGHDLVVLVDPKDIDEHKYTYIEKPVNNCAVAETKEVFDQIFTDINGWSIVAGTALENYAKYRCKFRLLDSFGTEAEFNLGGRYSAPIPGGPSPWSSSNLNLQQIMTFFPHSPDNVFLGFAVPRMTSTGDKNPPIKKLQGLVYGKLPEYFKGKKKYLDILHKHVEIHATLGATKEELADSAVPAYVINHGIVNSTEYIKLLKESKVFIGLGFPFEGPGPLDAIANGCFFINPKIRPAKDRLNSAFLKDKPFLRKITSQNPYAEDFIGKPYVYTIDIHNETEVENTIKDILISKATPKLPYEFTHEGLLQRVNFFVENLEFCKPHELFHQDELKVITTKSDESCKDGCFNKGFLCEPSFFKLLNDKERFERHGLQCKRFLQKERLSAPSLNVTDGTCLLQKHPLYYSCVAHSPGIKRLCPCRSFQKEQVAFCQGCS